MLNLKRACGLDSRGLIDWISIEGLSCLSYCANKCKVNRDKRMFAKHAYWFCDCLGARVAVSRQGRKIFFVNENKGCRQ
jgi:hypothetical protein